MSEEGNKRTLEEVGAERARLYAELEALRAEEQKLWDDNIKENTRVLGERFAYIKPGACFFSPGDYIEGVASTPRLMEITKISFSSGDGVCLCLNVSNIAAEISDDPEHPGTAISGYCRDGMHIYSDTDPEDTPFPPSRLVNAQYMLSDIYADLNPRLKMAFEAVNPKPEEAQ
jgi:hypothetical protein